MYEEKILMCIGSDIFFKVFYLLAMVIEIYRENVKSLKHCILGLYLYTDDDLLDMPTERKFFRIGLFI